MIEPRFLQPGTKNTNAVECTVTSLHPFKMKKLFTKLIGLTFILGFGITAYALQTPTFSDVSSTHPHYEAITNLKFNGVIEGYPDGTFKPDQPVNRVEVLKMIFEGLETDNPESLNSPTFSDTDLNAWYGEYLKKAYTLGMVEGYQDGTFKPAQTVNLVENLKLILEAAKVDLPTDIPENPYNDTPKTEWYAKYVQHSKNLNLLDPDESDNVYPGKEMTRGDFAEVLWRLRTVIQQGLNTFEEDPETEEGESGIIDNQLSLNIRAENFSFMPKTLTIEKGTRITWTNYDSSSHIVSSDTNLFSSEIMQQNETYSRTFNELGTFPYHCNLHAEMTGTIEVLPVNSVPTI